MQKLDQVQSLQRWLLPPFILDH